jgi:hypothetical protein
LLENDRASASSIFFLWISMMKWTIVHFIIEIQVRFGEQVHDDSLSESRGSTVLIKTFESLDLGLAGLGLYNLHIPPFGMLFVVYNSTFNQVVNLSVIPCFIMPTPPCFSVS